MHLFLLLMSCSVLNTWLQCSLCAKGSNSQQRSMHWLFMQMLKVQHPGGGMSSAMLMLNGEIVPTTVYNKVMPMVMTMKTFTDQLILQYMTCCICCTPQYISGEITVLGHQVFV